MFLSNNRNGGRAGEEKRRRFLHLHSHLQSTWVLRRLRDVCVCFRYLELSVGRHEEQPLLHISPLELGNFMRFRCAKKPPIWGPQLWGPRAVDQGTDCVVSELPILLAYSVVWIQRAGAVSTRPI